jgi:hypothetical protein
MADHVPGRRAHLVRTPSARTAVKAVRKDHAVAEP